MNILVILTCYNRREKTINCIKSLKMGNLEHNLSFIVVDDNSTDGTVEALEEIKEEYAVHLIKGSGNMYYSGGMRLGMDYALDNLKYDYLLMVNDDVRFFEGCIDKIIAQSREQNNSVIAGAMCDTSGQMTYSAVKYTKGIKYRKLKIDEWNIEADTFNANCVLIPYDAFVHTGSIDTHYIHSLGDFDYGLSLKRAGYHIYVSREYAGICESNSNKGTWTDTSLSRKERMIKKESVKGAPARQWFYFLKKNFSLLIAIKGSITPYIRILIRR
jgi:GT2 family glycosyltransferase